MKENTLTSSFYAYLTRLRWIKRWGLKRNAHEENVMEHSWEVSVIAHTLALIKNRYFNGQVDANAIATAALYHDITEVITGDLPTPIKYYSEEIRNAYKEIEKQAEMELLHLLPSEIREDFRPLICHEHLPEEHIKIIKAADKISAYLKCQAELKAGNLEFEIAAEHLALRIAESDQQEVAFFMRVFAPSCGLTLDGLMKTY
ncbi:5'-deoxynucleotidase [Methylovulum psychrotolerans]|uniref:5'-deoxynucleotidase n=1 Tax=Methylovulum psychrotolerans TaxID=1704499 RepID=A0A1Z4BTM7_9GAMM|nr:5'-deoxynucleotidase [Methylovulum psychrotolerans]ASF44645.1 5'-deoxynucleotidase [Methylovulum psychrotolerans]MBT9098750.1 5'-deoxynucleotidase [Methylovulum psychrotolerans]POZ52661.1 5'-deoxynucleotidase [Methylovulum psychrotolerans]